MAKFPNTEKQEKSIVSRWFFLGRMEMEPHGEINDPIQPPVWGDIPAKRWRISPRPRPWSRAAGVNRRGTTLTELLAAMAIVALAATLIVPNIGRPLGRYKLKIAAREISNFLQETRAEGIKNADSTTPVAYRVVFNSALGTYTRQKFQSGAWANDGPAKTLPTKITIVNLIPGDTINTYFFRTDGSLALDVANSDTGLTDPTDEVFDAAPVTLRIQLRNARNDHYEVNVFSLTGLTEIKEGWSS